MCTEFPALNIEKFIFKDSCTIRPDIDEVRKISRKCGYEDDGLNNNVTVIEKDGNNNLDFKLKKN